MKGFIEVHWKKDGAERLFNLRHIVSIDGSFIMTSVDVPFCCVESYEEIVKLIEEAL